LPLCAATLAAGGEPPELVVAMHGTGRGFTGYRDAFAEFGRWNNCIILAPLFPIGVLGDGNRDGFKYMREGDIRYDHLLLAMVDEVAQRYGLPLRSLRPVRLFRRRAFHPSLPDAAPAALWACSIGAPGSVTLLDPTRDWWVGTRNMAGAVRQRPDLAGPAPAAGADGGRRGRRSETWEITHREGGRTGCRTPTMPATTRVERLASLQRSFEAAGVNARFDCCPTWRMTA
jgi:hypothetical protein